MSLMPTYAPADVVFAEGHGTVLYDTEGRSYLDFLSGIAVTSLGHSNPAVAAALSSQAARLWHVSNLFENELAGRLASELDELIGGGRPLGGGVFLANSGAEANECALKLARKAGGRGRHHVLSAYGSFHGRTLATLHATGQPHKHEAFQPLPEGFAHVAFGDLEALAAAADATKVAAVLLEPIQGEGGVIPAPPGYLEGVRALCDERGILLIVDEIQTGLGRTGDWFAFQAAGVLPDIVTVAKSLGNGMPIGACWARADVASLFEPGDHGSTFGGQPLACSAALATLGELRRLDAPSLARKAGSVLSEGLAGIDAISEVRGRGLLLGAVLDSGRAGGRSAAEVATAALRAGLVLNAPSADVLRLAPPLTVSVEEVDQAVSILSEVLA
ncbi:MAG TPA: acetylornithine/succinylornithine family transaminase [Acidimicrobiales bacterium]|nr:acetylornithine/succinylornithine family transaminase [Acidimicrobiales bacterium]